MVLNKLSIFFIIFLSSYWRALTNFSDRSFIWGAGGGTERGRQAVGDAGPTGAVDVVAGFVDGRRRLGAPLHGGRRRVVVGPRRRRRRDAVQPPAQRGAGGAGRPALRQRSAADAPLGARRVGPTPGGVARVAAGVAGQPGRPTRPHVRSPLDLFSHYTLATTKPYWFYIGLSSLIELNQVFLTTCTVWNRSWSN